jgi:hypothetical protein
MRAVEGLEPSASTFVRLVLYPLSYTDKLLTEVSSSGDSINALIKQGNNMVAGQFESALYKRTAAKVKPIAITRDTQNT